MASDKEDNYKTYMLLFKSLTDEILGASQDTVLIGAKKLLDDPSVEKYLADEKVQPYVYVSGLLNLLGRDITNENVAKVLRGVGIEPDAETIDVLVKANNENGVIYVYSLYFLAILGKERNVKNIMDLVKSLGINPNETFAQRALDLYNKRYKNKP